MARSAPKPPFWSSSPKPKPHKLRGTHAELLDASEDGARVLPYDPAQRYDLGALVLHPSFGLGVVAEQTATGKVLVRFEDGDKLLVAGG